MTDSERMAFFREQFPEEGFFQDKEWVLSPRAFAIGRETRSLLEELGDALRLFQRACNDLYVSAAAGGRHQWVAELMDQGKPPEVMELGRREQWRDDLPRVIRPDLMLLEDGTVKIAEIDSLPGGIGLTAWLNETYAAMGEEVIGGADGMIEGFRMAFPSENILISAESADYAPEMEWLARRLGDGRRVARTGAVAAADLATGAWYRFFELFDLPQVEDSAALLELARQGRLSFTPPLKAYLEEKLWLALFWSPALLAYWEESLPGHALDLLLRCIPRGWVVDPAPLPPFAEIPGLGVNSWDEVGRFGRAERQLVLKVSGFSPLGWGSRGVRIGHDSAPGEWAAAIAEALREFPFRPRLMQRFHAAGARAHPAWDAGAGWSRPVLCRARLCPYYFAGAVGDRTTLGGVLATLCPADKKLLHGMRDAMMLPCVE